MRVNWRGGRSVPTSIEIDRSDEFGPDEIEVNPIPGQSLPKGAAFVNSPGRKKNLMRAVAWVKVHRPNWIVFTVASLGMGTAVTVFAVKKIKSKKKSKR